MLIKQAWSIVKMSLLIKNMDNLFIKMHVISQTYESLDKIFSSHTGICFANWRKGYPDQFIKEEEI